MASEPTSFSYTFSQAGGDNNNQIPEDEEAQALKKLQLQAKHLEVRACFYFLCFFLIVLSAYIPFMTFQKSIRSGIQQGFTYLIPLFLGITLTMGMVVAVLALLQLMSAQAIQKVPTQQDSKTDFPVSDSIASRVKKLQFISRLILSITLSALLINGVLTIFK